MSRENENAFSQYNNCHCAEHVNSNILLCLLLSCCAGGHPSSASPGHTLCLLLHHLLPVRSQCLLSLPSLAGNTISVPLPTTCLEFALISLVPLQCVLDRLSFPAPLGYCLFQMPCLSSSPRFSPGGLLLRYFWTSALKPHITGDPRLLEGGAVSCGDEQTQKIPETLNADG